MRTKHSGAGGQINAGSDKGVLTTQGIPPIQIAPTLQPRYDLISTRALEGVARVLAFGAMKHGERGWEHGLSLADNYRAAIGHLLAYFRGEEYDQESGLPHIDHALCRVMFATHLAHHDNGNAVDDREIDE